MLNRLTIPMAGAAVLALAPMAATATDMREKMQAMPASPDQESVRAVKARAAAAADTFGKPFPAGASQGNVADAKGRVEAPFPASKHQRDVLGLAPHDNGTPPSLYGAQFPATGHQKDVLGIEERAGKGGDEMVTVPPETIGQAS